MNGHLENREGKPRPTLVKAAAAMGVASGSLALPADAGHMLPDSAGLAIASIAAALAERPATAQRT